jgi:hypothetical protein
VAGEWNTYGRRVQWAAGSGHVEGGALGGVTSAMHACMIVFTSS